MSAARYSGSTLLGMILGAHPSIFYAGEANKVWNSGDPNAPLKNRVCKLCGPDCSVWGDLRADNGEDLYASVAVHRFQCPESELNDQLNRCLGVVICNMGVLREGGDEANRHFPETANGFTLAPEAMLKNFEVAAAGTVPFCDPTPDLAELGFLDGQTAVVYSSFDDLVDRLRSYQDQPERLREIGRRAADLVRQRHTWDHRVAFLDALLHSPDPAASELSWDLGEGLGIKG